MLALVICSHGSLAKELLRSCEMICGQGTNLAAVGLEPGESPEVLLSKYDKILKDLDTSSGVLFLTDLFGGSPYNTACRIAMERENIRVVAGVNLPMLLEAVHLLELSPDEVIPLVESAGKTGIQIFQQASQQDNEEDL